MRKLIIISGFILIAATAFSQGVPVIGTLEQKNDGTFPIVDSYDIKGGCVTGSDRNAFPDERRTRGMFFIDAETDSVFQLQGGVADENWVYLTIISLSSDIEPGEVLYKDDDGITGSPRFTWNLTDGLTLFDKATFKSYLNFEGDDVGDIIRINNYPFLRMFGFGNTCSMFGLWSGLNSFSEIGSTYLTTIFGARNCSHVDLSWFSNISGFSNFVGREESPFSLEEVNAYGSYNFYLPNTTRSRIDLYDIDVYGKNCGSALDSSSSHLTLIGNGMWNKNFDEDTIVSNELRIGMRGLSDESPTPTLTSIIFKPEERSINLNADHVLIRGFEIDTSGIGGQWDEDDDTLSTFKQVVFNGTSPDSNEVAKFNGNVNILGTLYANEIVTPDTLGIEDTDSLEFAATYFNVANGLMKGGDTVLTAMDFDRTDLQSGVLQQGYGGTGNWIENEFFYALTNVLGSAVSSGTSSPASSTVAGGNHPGIYNIKSHASNANSGYSYYQTISTNGSIMNSYDQFRATLMLVDTTNGTHLIGFNYTSATTNPTYGAYFLDSIGTKMRTVVENNSVVTYGDTTFTPELNTWYTFYVEFIPSWTHFWIKTDDGTIVFDDWTNASPVGLSIIYGNITSYFSGTPGGVIVLMNIDRMGYRANRVLTRPYD